MRTIKTTGFPQDTNLNKFPDGQINNETDTQEGTPVVREIYGDVLTNIYKLMRDSGVTANGNEDSETDGYQLLEAFKKFSNELNDIRQLATVQGTNINLNFNIDFLPDNYVFIGLISENVLNAQTYTISGTGALSYSIKPKSNISGASVCLFVLNQTLGNIVSLSSNDSKTLLPVNLGNPLAYNSSNEVYYFKNGILRDNTPTNYNIQQEVRLSQNNGELKVVDSIILKGKLLCLVFEETTLDYYSAQFDVSDLSTVEFFRALSVGLGVDNQPYIYTDGEFVYFSNTGFIIGQFTTEYSFGKYNYDTNIGDLSQISNFEINASFRKTTNAVIKNNKLITLQNGDYESFDFDNDSVVSLGSFDIPNGQLFQLDNKSYFTNGEIATEWNF